MGRRSLLSSLLVAIVVVAAAAASSAATAPADDGPVVVLGHQQQGAPLVLPLPHRIAQDAGNSTGDEPSPPPPSPPQCKLLGGAFADFLQLSLAAFGLIGLLVKRAKETPPRPWKIWGMDVGKQCIGSLYAHFVNMLLAMGLSTLAGGGLDECAWYFINYLTDSSLGIILCLVFMKLLEFWAGMQPLGSWARVYISQTGNYGKPPQCKIWYWQTLVWIGVVTVSKLGLFFFLLACADRFGSWGHVLFSPLKQHPQVELFIVMVLAPGCLNVVQFWVLDNLLKSNAPEVPSPPQSPGKANFKVSYEPILEGSGGANGRRRKGPSGGFSWFEQQPPPSQQQQQQHSWLRPMTWTWGSAGQGGPGGDGGAAAPYRPPQPAQQQAQPQQAGDGTQLPPWMTSNASVYRPYEDEEGATGGAIA